MNVVHLGGNLTRDPELKSINANGKETSVVNFTVACSRRFRKSDGSSDQETTFVNCEAWDSGADTIAKWFNKGDGIIVEGTIKNDKWADKDGQNRSRDKIRVNRFHFPPGRKQSDDSNRSNETVKAEEPRETADVPF